MKKILFSLIAISLLVGCSSMQQAQNLSNCKFSLASVHVTDYNLTSLGFDIVIAITNPSKTETAALKRFVGKLTVNDDYMADVTLKDIHIEPNSTKNAKAKVNVPLANISSKLIGLLSMGSGTLDYHLTGTMYFEGPLGVEIPIPVDIGRVGSTNG